MLVQLLQITLKAYNSPIIYTLIRDLQLIVTLIKLIVYEVTESHRSLCIVDFLHFGHVFNINHVKLNEVYFMILALT